MPDDEHRRESHHPGASLTVRSFGTFDADKHPRIRILEEGLRARGAVIHRTNVPWRAPTAMRVAALRRPWVGLRLLARLLGCWWRLWRDARREPDVDVVIVGYLGVLDVHLARWLWRRTPIVLDHLAPAAGIVEDRLAGAGLRGRLAAAVDAAATRRADLVVVDTEEHIPTGGAGRCLVVPVGASRLWFQARRATVAAGGPLSVVFFGLFTPLHGAAVIAAGLRWLAAEDVPVRATLIGSGQEHGEARRLLAGVPGITWREWVDTDELPAVVASHDVCLGIFGTTAKARRVVPNKVFQGAAAGCAIVTSDTPPQRRALADAGCLVPAGDATALADALGVLAADRDRVAALRHAAAARADAAFTAEAVVEPLHQRLGTLVHPS